VILSHSNGDRRHPSLHGSGPVRGFAVTLGLGIITTIITAVAMTHDDCALVSLEASANAAHLTGIITSYEVPSLPPRAG
jgi:hypothetical protein